MTELFRRDRPDGPLQWTGNVPARAARSLEMAGYDVRQLLGAATTVAAVFEDGAADDDAMPPRRAASATAGRRGSRSDRRRGEVRS